MVQRITAFLGAFALVSAVQAGDPSAALAQGGTRTVHVSVTDKKGVPVTDLSADEFELKVGGKAAAIVSAKPSTTPLRISLLVSDAGTGGFQLGIARFMQSLLGRAEFAVTSVIVQPERILDFTSDASALQGAVKRVGPRGQQRGAQLMEAIQGAARDVRAEGKRPVIVVVRVGAEDNSTLSGDDVKNELRKSGAALYVISTVGAERQPPSSARTGISTEQAQLHDGEVAEGRLNLGQVLGDGSKESGGHHDQIVSTTLVPTMEQLAAELLNQYELTYTPPDKAKDSDKVTVSSKRKGLTVRPMRPM
jgi:VWFA-related protein